MRKYRDRIFTMVIVIAMVFTTVFTIPLFTAAGELIEEHTFSNLTLDEETTSITENITTAKTKTYYYYYTPRTKCELKYEIETTGGVVQSIEFGKLSGEMKTYANNAEKVQENLEDPNQKYVLSIVKRFDGPTQNAKVKISAKLIPTKLEQPIEMFEEKFKSEMNYNLRKFYKFTPEKTCGYTFEITPEPGAKTSNTYIEVYSEVGNSLSYEEEYDDDFDKASIQVYLTKGKSYIIDVNGTYSITFKAWITDVKDNAIQSKAETITVGGEKEPKLTPLANRKGTVWYKIQASLDEEQLVEFNIDNTNPGNGSIRATAYDSGLYTDGCKDTVVVDPGEVGTIYKTLEKGSEWYYLKIEEEEVGSAPVNDQGKYELSLNVKKHIHDSSTIQVDGDEGLIIKGCKCGDLDQREYEILLDSVKFPNKTYTGNQVTLTPTFEIIELDSKPGVTPSIPSNAYYKPCIVSTNKVSVGPVKVKVEFKGLYKELGTYTSTFYIYPKGTTLSKLTAATRGFTATWNKRTTQTTGYQIRYSTSSSMSGAKTSTISSYKTVSKKISSLKSKKYYYVQVRTYKTVSGKKYYSGWSSTKKVKTK